MVKGAAYSRVIFTYLPFSSRLTSLIKPGQKQKMHQLLNRIH